MGRPQLSKGAYIKKLDIKNTLMRTYPNDDNFIYDGLKHSSLFWCLGYQGPCQNHNILNIKACDAYTSKGLCLQCQALFKRDHRTDITTNRVKEERAKAKLPDNQIDPYYERIFNSWMN